MEAVNFILRLLQVQQKYIRSNWLEINVTAPGVIPFYGITPGAVTYFYIFLFIMI